jgi:predicted  nucleic acid-binding Zn-ribbon protein
LAEAEEFAVAERRLADHHAAIAAAAKQLSDAETTIETIEVESAALTAKRSRLEQQLKIVTEIRQADALNHEIEIINGHRDELDDRELEAMEQQADAEQRLAELAADEDTVVAMKEAAAAQLAVAKGAGADEETELTARFDAARAVLTSEETALYDEQRARHGGIGIAKLVGLRCDGCHLDLSRAEVDAFKALPADELVDCPQCGRVLVR